jgi:hypothetical protein
VTDALTVAKELCGRPADADEAHAHTPGTSGLYAWWAPAGLLPGVCGPAHPGVDGLELQHVGLAQNVRARVVGNHFRGPTGSSTLRRGAGGLPGVRRASTTGDRLNPVRLARPPATGADRPAP